MERARRHSGKSKYSFRKLLKLAFDGIFSFSVVPLRAATFLGGLAITASCLFAIYSLFAKFVLQQSPTGFTALYISMAFFAGVQLMFLGVIGEYVGRIYEEVKRRPLYIVNRVLNASRRVTDVVAPANRVPLATVKNAPCETPLAATTTAHE